jgi:hypothetical protein
VAGGPFAGQISFIRKRFELNTKSHFAMIGRKGFPYDQIDMDHVTVRIPPPQPASPAPGDSTFSNLRMSANGGLSRFSRWSLRLRFFELRGSPKVSGPTRGYSRFRETGADRPRSSTAWWGRHRTKRSIIIYTSSSKSCKPTHCPVALSRGRNRLKMLFSAHPSYLTELG